MSYKSFWTYELLRHLIALNKRIVSTNELKQLTGFCEDDILDTLHDLKIAKSSGKEMFQIVPNKMLEAKMAPFNNKKMTTLDPEFLKWPIRKKPPVVDNNKKK